MNLTIEKIVNLLFEDLAETEETIAIRDEILTNCQDRYLDMTEAGMSEDDAIHAVIESLNGMEEMLKEYPRKEKKPAPELEESAEAAEEASREWSCDPNVSTIREIRLEHMGSIDVAVETSSDGLIHVECGNPRLGLMTAVSDGVLTVGLSETSDPHMKFSADLEFDLKSLGRLFDKICRKFTATSETGTLTLSVPESLLPALHIGTESGDVAIAAMPFAFLRAGTVSGDININDVTVDQELRLTSASGDITLSNVRAAQLYLSAISGDVDVQSCNAHTSVRLNTTSGDISWNGSCMEAELSTISGDAELNGTAEKVSFRTVSGDASIILHGGQLKFVKGNTTSGNLDVRLPEGLEVDLHLSAMNSHISSHANCVPGAPVVVTLSTVSGDMSIY